MRREHLTDEQIQAYLDAAQSRAEGYYGQVHAESHLQECLLCRQTLVDYQQVFSALDDCPEPQLSSGFTEGVVNRLQAQGQVSENRQSLLAAILAPLIALMTMVFTLDLPALFTRLLFRMDEEFVFWKTVSSAYASLAYRPVDLTADWSIFERLVNTITAHPEQGAIALVVAGIVTAFMAIERLAARAEFRRT
jgi:hypothetical protein